MLHLGRPGARAAGAATVLGLAATLAVASPAAAATDWGNLGSLERAKLQACKVSADGGDSWKVKLRVKNRNGYWVKATVTVLQGDVAQDERWRSGRVARRSTSAVGSVKTGRTDDWSLTYSIGASQFGGGGVKSVSAIRGC